MAEGLNRVFLHGNLGQAPELKYTNGGTAVLRLRLATNESYLDKQRVRRERTEWHSVAIWGKRGEALARLLHKGSALFVEGRLRTQTWDGEDGHKHSRTEVVAQNVILGQRSRRGPDDSRHGDAFEGEEPEE